MRRIVWRFLAAVVLVLLAFAFAGTLAGPAHAGPRMMPQGSVQKIEWSWTSNAGGFWQSGVSREVTGWIVGVKFTPSSSAAPTANYDVSLLDTGGLDYFQGQGNNLPATSGVTRNIRSPLTSEGEFPFLWMEDLAPKVENAGASKSGTVSVFVRW